MKYILYLLLFWTIACTPVKNKSSENKSAVESLLPIYKNIVGLQSLIDSTNGKGSVLIYSPTKSSYYSNNFEWAEKSFLPASTFKIPNSIVAMELGIIKNDSSMFYWNGEDRFQDRWERDMNFKDALQLSCVPCYQYLAREIGTQRMLSTLDKIGYPGMVVDSTNIDMFWLEGDSKITSFEQIGFLKRFYDQELPISLNTFTSMKNMLLKEENDDYNLSGKSGWSYTNGIDNCWFIGYIEKENEVYFFATNLEPPVDVDFNTYPKVREDITIEAFRKLKIIK
jgi:beta-lactamase class D